MTAPPAPPERTPPGPIHTLIPLDPTRTAADHALGRPMGSDDVSLGEAAAPDPAPVEPRMRPLAGAYEPLGRLGEGGVGVVFLARQTVLAREVAIKSVHPRAHARAARTSLLREARAMAALEHPGIVPVYDLVKGGGDQPGVVMQRIAGETWATYLAQPERVEADFGALDLLAWHLGVLIQVCNAAHFAHTRGVVHRDLKPENVMIGRFGEVYVLDWGLAASLGDDGPAGLPRVDRDRRIVGTPRFMAPEMAAGEGHRVTARTDVYLLAGLLYCVLAGHGPHLGESVEETLRSIPSFEPNLPASTPQRLADLVTRGLAADPADRFESAEALRRALQRAQEERGADHLVEQAHHQLALLEAELQAATPDREALYRRFGAARFGFQQAAQQAGAGHGQAADGLRDALLTMARYELAQGDLRGADLLLADVADPPDGVVAARARLQASQQAGAAARARARQDADPTVGQRTRIFVFTLFMGLWTVLPLVQWSRGDALTLPGMVAGHAINLVLVLGLIAWARESLSRTALNRRVALLIAVVSAALLLGDLGGWALGLHPNQVVSFHQLMFAVLCALAGDIVNRAAWPLAGAYLGLFALGIARPGLLLPGSAAVNLVVAITAFRAWAPENHRVLFSRHLDGPSD